MRTILSALLSLALLPLHAAGAGKPRYEVSVFNLGVAGGKLETADLLKALSEGNWCEAVAAPPTERWNRRPAAAPPGAWLSVVVAGFGEQAHVFAFQFDEAGRATRLAAHVPFGMTQLYSSRAWIPPASRIAAALKESSRKPADPPARPAVRLVVAEQPETAAPSAGATLESLTPVKRASSVSARDALPPLEAMLAAVLLENGRVPAWTAADEKLTAEVRPGFKVASFRFTLEGAGAPRTLEKANAPEDHYFRYLARLLDPVSLKGGSGISDFAAIGSTRLLGVSSNRLCAITALGLAGFDLRSGKRVYPESEERPKGALPDYAARPEGPGPFRLFRISGGLAGVDMATGAETALAPESPSAPWSFATAADGSVVLSRDERVLACRQGTPAWTHRENHPVTAGPAVEGDTVFLGTAGGDLVALDRATGKERWRRTTGGAWHGGMAVLDGLVLAFDKNGDSLAALDARDGRERWRRPVGDVLLDVPALLGNRLLAAGKNNRILLLDPATGEVAREVRWPSWLVDIRPLPGPKPQVACTDIRGIISFLDAGTLEPVRTIGLKARPSGPLLAAPAFPTVWGTEGGDDEDTEFAGLTSEIRRALLAADRDGIFSIVPLP